MAKYYVHMEVSAWHTEEVEADNPKEAEEKAFKKVGPWISLCHQCSDEFNDHPEFTGEVDVERIS